MEQTSEHQISVIVPCTRPDKVCLLLDGFEKQHKKHSFEVILIGDIPANLDKYRFAITPIKTKNIHVNQKRNMGLKQAKGLAIALLDDDTIPSENWVEQALLSVKENPESLVAGREIPVQTSEDAKLAFSVSQLLITEGYKGHVNSKMETVNWWDVPFCNCVGNAQIFKGGFDISISWDMDDFHFCFSRKDKILFRNNPSLLVKHDRYPSSISQFLNYKWKLRVRTGEKIISHSGVYLKIPTMVVLLVAPLVLAIIFWSGLYVLLIPAYFLAITVSAAFSDGTRIAKKTGLIFRIHLITFFGFWYGIIRGIRKLFDS